jgi:SAM-dependent methyltransferase
MLTRFLSHQLTRGLDLDAPETTGLRRRIIQEKGFLRRIYEEWYEDLAAAVPLGEGEVLELGSGAGFLRDYIPGLITSDVFELPGVSLVADAHDLPFGDGALRAVVMTNVLHHLAEPRRFFQEAARCVRPGGVVAMIEPWHTPWSRLIYTRLHHEPFEPKASEWEFPPAGPLSGANGALPWILFDRDQTLFESQFPHWRIEGAVPMMPFRYLLSGGVSLRSLMPGWTFRGWRWLERRLARWMNRLGMFARIILVRTEHPAHFEGMVLPRQQR